MTDRVYCTNHTLLNYTILEPLAKIYLTLKFGKEMESNGLRT